jgi:hypothetical protein
MEKLLLTDRYVKTYTESPWCTYRNRGRGALLHARALSPEGVVQRLCHGEGVSPEELVGGSRRAPVSRARAGIAYVWLEWLGRNGPRIVPLLGISVPAVYRVAQRGRQQAEHWQRIVSD